MHKPTRMKGGKKETREQASQIRSLIENWVWPGPGLNTPGKVSEGKKGADRMIQLGMYGRIM